MGAVESSGVVQRGVFRIIEFLFGLRAGVTYDIHFFWISVGVGTVAVRSKV